MRIMRANCKYWCPILDSIDTGDDHDHDDCDADQTDDDDDVGGRGQGQLQVLVSRRDNKQEVKTRNLFAIISGVYMHLLMLCTRCLCFLSCIDVHVQSCYKGEKC